MNISPKSKFFDFFRTSEKKRFIITDDKEIVGKVLKVLELADKKDEKLTLIKLKFSINGYKNLTENKFFNLSSVAQVFFSANL